MEWRKRILTLSAAGVLALAESAGAFTITGQLTGDLRSGNPDGLIVDVTVTVNDLNPTSASWLIDINSPLHPDTKLDEFYFNLTGLGSAYAFSGFDPNGWAVNTPATVQGVGGASFLFEALDEANGNDRVQVTNTQNLSFTMSLAGGGNITESMFLDAPVTIGNDGAGSGQLGAHLQSLTVPAGTNQSDSGFAFGSYGYEDGGTPGGGEVPEPGTLLLLGSGLLGLGGAVRRRQGRK